MIPANSIRPSYAHPGAVSNVVDMDLIRIVVDDFYGRVRQDQMLGPVFETHIDEWEPHLNEMSGFWSTVLLGDRQYTGNPFKKHHAIPELSAAHFRRWLNLFAETLEAHCSPPEKAVWEATARRMGYAMASRLGFGEHADLLP